MPARTGHGEPVAPLVSLRRHPVIVTTLLLIGLLLGLGAALVVPASYKAETRVAVVPANTSAYTIAGYPLGARELAADYARWVRNRGADNSWFPSGVSDVVASPIPDSAVVRIEVEASSEDAAVAGAGKVANQLLQQVTDAKKQHDPAVAYAQFTQLSPQVAKARSEVTEAERALARATVGTPAHTQAQTRWQDAATALSEIQLRHDAAGDLYRRLYSDTAGNSNLEIVSPAESQGDPERSAFLRYGIVGLGAGGLAALLITVLMDRRRSPVDEGSARA